MLFRFRNCKEICLGGDYENEKNIAWNILQTPDNTVTRTMAWQKLRSAIHACRIMAPVPQAMPGHEAEAP